MQGQQEGIVIGVLDGGLAQVKTSRHSDCENCGSCPGNSALVLEARNPLGARPGQRVMIEVQEINMLKSAFIVYLLPLIAIFIGAVLGSYLAEHLALDVLWLQVGGGGLAFAGSVFYIKYFDRSARTDIKMQPVITRIVTE
ncbi:MAG: SoxR reducing system RseC family protein [Negativicutes bacterium]|nr:SoxR reducing system RseC family protein [Negativicutes bacterium]